MPFFYAGGLPARAAGNSFAWAFPGGKPSVTREVGKGPWHMAKSIATGVGLTNAWLHAQGLLSLKSLWAELAPLRRTA